MRLTNLSSTEAVVAHDVLSADFAAQYQDGVRSVTWGPSATVTIPNIDAAASRSIRTLVNTGKLSVVDFIEPFETTVGADFGESFMPGLTAGIQVVQKLTGQVTGTITLPTGTGIDAVGDYIVLLTGSNADWTVAKGAASYDIAGTGTADVVVLKII